MPNAELDELIRAVVQKYNDGPAAPTQASTPMIVVDTQESRLISQPAAPGEISATPSSTPREADSLTSQFDALRRALAAQEAAVKENTEGLASAASKASQVTTSASSVTKTFINNIGSTLGLSPVIKGLAKLFSGSGEAEAPATLPSFTLPPALRIDSGLDSQTQSLRSVSYGQSNEARLPLTPRVTPATIQVNINAIDSQSFMDHSGDIARAVKEAMLHAHSLNDVVQEL